MSSINQVSTEISRLWQQTAPTLDDQAQLERLVAPLSAEKQTMLAKLVNHALQNAQNSGAFIEILICASTTLDSLNPNTLKKVLDIYSMRFETSNSEEQLEILLKIQETIQNTVKALEEFTEVTDELQILEWAVCLIEQQISLRDIQSSLNNFTTTDQRVGVFKLVMAVLMKSRVIRVSGKNHLTTPAQLHELIRLAACPGTREHVTTLIKVLEAQTETQKPLLFKILEILSWMPLINPNHREDTLRIILSLVKAVLNNSVSKFKEVL